MLNLPKLDRIDINILAELQKSGRITNAQLADKVGLSASPCLARVKRLDRPVSEVCRRFEPVPQLLKNVRFAGGKPLENAAVRQAIADAEAELATKGRLVIRPSGTEPLIRVMAEGDDRAQVERIVGDLVTVIANARPEAA